VGGRPLSKFNCFIIMKKLFLIPAAVLVLAACGTEPVTVGTPNATEVVATENASENASDSTKVEKADSAKVKAGAKDSKATDKK
jgi:uncharacterized lipoprotein YajG